MSALDNYMLKNFPNLMLKSPLFYHTDFSIRFDLEDDSLTTEEEHVNFIESRVIALLNSCINPSDEVFIITYGYTWKDKSLESLNEETLVFFNKYTNFKVETKLVRTEIESLYEDEDDDDDWNSITHRYWFNTKANNIDFDNLLQEKITSYFDPEIDIGALFIINSTENVIIHLYSDQGIDIVSKDKSTLIPVYLKYNEWILDFDRIAIDNTFKNE